MRTLGLATSLPAREQFPFSLFPALKRDPKHIIHDLAMRSDDVSVCDVCRRGAPDDDMREHIFITAKGTYYDWWHCGNRECKMVIDGLCSNGFYKRPNRAVPLAY